MKESLRHSENTLDQINQSTKDFEIGDSQIELLKRLQINEYTVVASLFPSSDDTSLFQEYLSRLKQLGIDVGKGDTKYGFKMPLPNKEDTDRKLIIFRRK